MDGKALRILFDLLEEYGIKSVVCSPGSRNASLLMEADLHSKMKKYVVVDERTAGFVALGHSLVSQSPVALVCTSGTALLNYAPAIAEAYYQNVPLIVISADRPMEWIDQDDSQTIRQGNVFANYSKYFANIDASNSDDTYLWYLNRSINEGLIAALSPRRGPVHFNIHLPGKPFIAPQSEKVPAKKFDFINSDRKLDKAVLQDLARRACGKRIMITAGFLPPDNRIQKAMALLASLPNVCVMAETVSNLHLPPSCYSIDRPLFSMGKQEYSKFRPDILISVGGALISRRLKEFLRECRPEEHWAVGDYTNVIDCFMSLTTILDVSPSNFLPYFAKRLGRIQKDADNVSRYRELWEAARYKTEAAGLPTKWSDLTALHRVFEALPESCNLFLSNGTAVRYAQILNHRPPHATFANRGVSGIEGSTSTATGGMLAYGNMTCLVSGDLSFNYDIGALGTGLADGRLKVVVTANGGGDIFRFIGATSDLDVREKYLCADMKTDFRKVADTYGWNYLEASDMKSLENALGIFFMPSEKPSLLCIHTADGDTNAEILRQFLSGKQ